MANAAIAAPNDTLLRAAYCVGVIDDQLSDRNDLAPENSDACLEWQRQGWQSRDACFYDGLAKMRSEHEKRRKRYLQYLEVQILLGTRDDAVLMAVAKAHGSRDARALRTDGPSDSAMQCMRECATGGVDACVMPCLSRHDPTAAHVFRCTTGDDGLPF